MKKQSKYLFVNAVSWYNDTDLFPLNVDKHIVNLSSYELSLVEKQALCKGLNFCIPFLPRQEYIDCEFERYFNQLSFLNASSADSLTKLKSDLVSTSKSFRSWRRPTVLPREHLQALRDLRSNKDLIICKPDKGNSVVLLDRSDYVSKVDSVLSDGRKFSFDNSNKDRTASIEMDVTRQIKHLRSDDLIDEDLSKLLMPIGSTLPKLYGLPKIHKKDCPVRPILSMCNSPTYQLAKWLADVLKPVNDLVAQYCVPDSFSFAQRIRDTDLKDVFLVSYDAVSLFTNVPIIDTLEMIRKVVMNHDLQLEIPVDTLCSLISLCVEDVQFSFDNKLYVQSDGVAMGSPLGPVLSNIFLGFLETHLLANDINRLTVSYSRFVDDTFVIVRSLKDSESLLSILNSVHPNLSFTIESEQASFGLPFLDVLVSRDSNNKAITSVYRKNTWSGLYTDFHSFVPIAYKRGLVRNLFHRARQICSPSTYNKEEVFLFSTLRANSYPDSFIKKHKDPVNSQPLIGPKLKEVFLRLPFIGDSQSRIICQRIIRSTRSAFPHVRPVFLFTTKRIPSSCLKDINPPLKRSHVIYRFCCDCGSSYIGRTERVLISRVKEHVPRWLQEGNSRNRIANASAICRHAIDCDDFQGTQFSSYFSIKAFSYNSFSLRILESLLILKHKPPLCVQKDRLLTLKLPW